MLNRRHLLLTGAASALCIMHPATARLAPERKIFLENTHTGESFHDVYWADGDYVAEALSRLNVLLRDHRTDEVTEIDPALIDTLARLRLRIETAKPIEITSAYRSPETNAAVRRRNRHAALNSFHMHGKAVDIQIPGMSVSRLRRAAISLKAGGVGTYPDANFVHLDVGPVRVW